MKRMKSLTALLLAVAMLIGVLPIATFAADVPTVDYSGAVGKHVVFSMTEDTGFYKKADLSASSMSVAAADLAYLDATVKSYTVASDGTVFYGLQSKSINNVVNLKAYSYVQANTVNLTDDPNPVCQVSTAVNGQTISIVGRMPRNITLQVIAIDTADYVSALETVGVVMAGYDISLMNGGVEFEPLTPVSVTIDNFSSSDENVRVFHLVNDDPDNLAYTSAQEISYDSAAQKLTFTADSFSTYLMLKDAEIVAAINTGLGLAAFKPYVYKNDGTAVTTITHDLSINGTIFTDYFYYTAVQKDAEFGSSAEYANYLVNLYRDKYDAVYGETLDAPAAETAALEAVEEKWNYYLYDIYDPEFQKMNDTDYYTHYTPNSMGDKGFEWPKSSNNYSSFHYADPAENKILPLEYNHLENGVEYDNFVSGLSKTATAAAPGDANSERQYDVQIVADAQAKVKAPVVMIFQIQTAWQLFDLEHANKLKVQNSSYTDDNTEVGAVADNTDLATLYEIKRALLEFVEYMEAKYPGNNLFLGFTETKHDASTSMFRNGSGVSNNEEILKNGIINWDIFGNCEHVHYDSDNLEDVVKNLEEDLAGLADMDNVPIAYDDISKAVIVIGGPTEKTDGTNGYACVLPWKTFHTNKIDAVYGIRVNDGTSYVTSGSDAGAISWLDYSKNNTGAPYAYDPNVTDQSKIETGNFTHKYVATDRQAIVDALIAIAETQMQAKGIDLTASDVYVDDLTVSDTISPEFEIDTSAGKQIIATLYDKEGDIVEGPVVYDENAIDPAADGWNVTVNPDGSTSVSYNFSQVYNGYKAVLDIPIIAKEDYIGSNNVLTNVGTPTAEYKHTPIVDDVPQSPVTYPVKCSDTPEVNVPIRYSAEDGGETTVWLGTSYDLANLDSDQIIADIMDRIDNYEQINGTVTFEWILPDGSVDPIDGEIVVKNGTYDHNDVPYLYDEYQFTEEGTFDAYLRIIFTPNDVKNNGNFSDTDTAVAVEPRTEDGEVDITVIFGEATVDYYVRKVWDDEEDHTGDEVTYQLLANGEPYYDENDEPVIRVLNEGNGWQDKIEGLPAAIKINDVPQMVEYSVIELTEPDGYIAAYSTDTQIDEVWNGYLRLTLNAGNEANIEKAKFVHVNFTYNGVTYDYDYPLYIGDKNDPANQKLAKKVDNIITLKLPYNTPVQYSGVEDQYGTECALTLPVGADGSILGNVTINDIFTYQERKYEIKDTIWKQTTYTATFPSGDKTFIICEAEVVSDLISRDEVPVMVITNTPKVHCVPDVVVVDFGLPVDIHVLANDMFGSYGTLKRIVNVSDVDDLDNGSSPRHAEAVIGSDLNLKFGTASLGTDTDGITYTPTTMSMDGVDTFAYEVQYTNGDSEANGYYYGTVTIVPATTIYYEDSFVDFVGNWEDAGEKPAGVIPQEEDRPGTHNLSIIDANNVYGFDKAYANCDTYSLGSARWTTVSKDAPNTDGTINATFTFTGTAFDIISVTSKDTGTIVVLVEDSEGEKVAEYVVNTFYGYIEGETVYHKYTWIHHDGAWYLKGNLVETATEAQYNDGDKELPTANIEDGKEYVVYDKMVSHTVTEEENALYQIPVIKSEDFEYGTYTVTITPKYSALQDACRDGSYDFYLDAIRIYNPAGDDKAINDIYYQDNEGKPTYFEVRNNLIAKEAFKTEGSAASGVVFIDKYGEIQIDSLPEYTFYGPNNEVYLQKGEGIAFAFEATDPSAITAIHIGLKAVNSAVTVSINGKNITLNTSTDMYYDLSDAVNFRSGETTSQPVVILANGDGMLSVTNIKVTTKKAADAANNGVALMMNGEALALALDQIAIGHKPVASTVYGDFNVDGAINAHDLSLLRKFFASYDYTTGTSSIVIEGWNPTARDLAKLRKYLAAYDYETGASGYVLVPDEQ